MPQRKLSRTCRGSACTCQLLKFCNVINSRQPDLALNELDINGRPLNRPVPIQRRSDQRVWSM